MSLRRATGQAAFTGDVALAGTLHLAVRRSPLAHARVARVDAQAARSLPGVAAVLTAEDADGLLGSVVRFVGDRLAVAAAEEPELARRAADAVALELEPLPALLDADAAALDEASVVARVEAEQGEVDEALARADQVVEGEWSLPFSPGVALEPPLAVTWLDEDRRLVVRTSADSPFRVRGVLAERLSLPAARIRVVRPLVAGGSRGRADLLAEDVCALVTLRTGRPARLAMGFEEALALAPGRPAQKVRIRLGLSDRRLVGLDVRVRIDLGAEHQDAGDLLRSSGQQAFGPYRVPHARFTGLAVRTNHPPASVHGGADTGAAFALECAVDELAALVDEDAAALRRRHLRGPGDPDAGLLAALGAPEGPGDVRAIGELLGAFAREPDRPRRWAPTSTVPGFRRTGHGLGVACRVAAPAGRAGAAAALRLLDDGSFTLAASPSAAGGVDEVAYAEAAAAILGVPPSRVVCAAADTDSALFDPGGAPPAPDGAGGAVEEVSRLARERLREAGARLLDVAVEDAVVEDGTVRDVQGRSLGFAEIGAAALRDGRPFVVTATPGTGASPPSLAAALAEVELDGETGIVRVTRLSASVAGEASAGRRPIEAQIEGALALALEQALAGGLSFDEEGRPRRHSLRGFPLVTASDLPPLSVTFRPGSDPTSRFASLSVGEATTRAALAAIVNAASHAAGARLRELPLLPGRTLEALRKASSR